MPAAMVIFGVSGDLTSRKLMPALYDLAVDSSLPEGFSIVGVSHRDWSDDEFRAEDARGCCCLCPHHRHRGRVARIRQRPQLRPRHFNDPGTYTRWVPRSSPPLTVSEAPRDRTSASGYTPNFFLPIIHGLETAGVSERQANYIEPAEGLGSASWGAQKPFGHDLASARDLISNT